MRPVFRELVSIMMFTMMLAGIILGLCTSSFLTHIFGLENHIVVLMLELLLAVTFALGVTSFGTLCLVICYISIKSIVTNKTHPYLLGLWTQEKKAEKWAIALGWWIPRKHRGVLVGDILEDCHEMREAGYGEWRIRIQAIWQWAIGVLTLVPNAMITALWRIVSAPK